MKHTRKQISEAIKYWKNRLNILNESYEAEEKVINNLQKIIEKSIQTYTGKKLNLTKIHKFHPNQMKGQIINWKYYNIFHAGNKDSSDIYLNIPNISKSSVSEIGNNIDEDISFVGIEVKENIGSKLFNPSLKFDGNDLKLTNQYLNSVQTPNIEKFNNILIPEKYKIVMVKNIREIINYLDVLGIDIKAFPWNYKDDDFNSQQELIDYLSNEYSIGKNKLKQQRQISMTQSRHLDPKIVNKISIAFDDLLARKTNSIKLASYEISGNDIVKMYFNDLRNRSGNYWKVNYIQFGESLYKLNDNSDAIEDNFFLDNNIYKVKSYDEDFSGVKITWKLDFSNKASDNWIRIKGDVTSIQNTHDNASLNDLNKAPLVYVPQNLVSYIKRKVSK